MFEILKDSPLFNGLDIQEVDSLINNTLAELIGVARPFLARTISEMESEKLFLWERNQVTIFDLKSIQAQLGK